MTSTAASQHRLPGLLFAIAALAENVAIAYPGALHPWPSIVLDVALVIAFLSAAWTKQERRLVGGMFGLTAVASAVLLGFDLFRPGANAAPVIFVAIVGCLGSGIAVVANPVFSRPSSILFLVGMVGLSVVLAERIYPYLSALPYVIVGEIGVATLFVAGVLIFRGSTKPVVP